MSESGEELYRIATALEKIAKQGEHQLADNSTLAQFINELNLIIDASSNEFILRQSLRRFICRMKDSLEQ